MIHNLFLHINKVSYFLIYIYIYSFILMCFTPIWLLQKRKGGSFVNFYREKLERALERKDKKESCSNNHIVVVHHWIRLILKYVARLIIFIILILKKIILNFLKSNHVFADHSGCLGTCQVDWFTSRQLQYDLILNLS